MLLKKHPVSSIAVLSALFIAQSAWAAADSASGALTGGKANVDLRYRYEDVKNALVAPAKNTATAHTLRARVGYTTGTFGAVSAGVEVDSILDMSNKTYDSKRTGQTGAYGVNNYAVIADPESTELNQLWLGINGIASTNVKIGRQVFTLDNERFVGRVAWRQNDQTFDGVTLVNKSLPNTTITFAYFTNVNRVFGDKAAADDNTTPTVANSAFSGNHKMQSPLLNIRYDGWKFGSVTGYAYMLDYDPGTFFEANSTETFGIRLNGSAAMGNNKVLYTLETANQRNAYGNPTHYQTSYTLLEGGVDLTNVAVIKAGYEILGSDTGAANTQFKTPLATLHAFNGWADMFLTTPTQGLKDSYLKVNGKVAGVNLGFEYHQYDVDVSTVGGMADLGDEYGLIATYSFAKRYTIGAKYSDYQQGDAVAAATYPSTQKTWLWGELKF